MCDRTEFDHSKLRGIMREKGITQKDLADKIGVNKSSLSQKLNNIATFTQSEIFKICNVLEISEDNIAIYFFTQKVQKLEHFKKGA